MVRLKMRQYFIFICQADEQENGDVDFTNPIIHEMANPAYGVSIRPTDIMNDAKHLTTHSSPETFLC